MTSQFSPAELATCARRELTHRRRVYARLVTDGRMSQKTAAQEIAMMEAIAQYFEEKAQPKLL